MSEETTDKVLLVHKILREPVYNTEGDKSIIQWTDPDIETDVALSFAEPSGCERIWSRIKQIQAEWHPYQDRRKRSSQLVDEMDSPGSPDALNGEARDLAWAGGVCVCGRGRRLSPFPTAPGHMRLHGSPFGGPLMAPIDVPIPDRGNLDRVAKLFENPDTMPREAICAQLDPRDRGGVFVTALTRLFDQCEAAGDQEGVLLCFRVVRGLLALNDLGVLEELFKEQNIMSAVGALEYDPELPSRPQHREFLLHRVAFKQVVPIQSEVVRQRIHQTYKIGYIKDVALARVLDDSSFNMMTSMIYVNNMEVMEALLEDQNFFVDLFARLRACPPDSPDWQDLTAFLQEFCSLARHLNTSHKGQFYNRVNKLGLYEVLTVIMRHGGEGLRLRATEILLTAVQHEAFPLRKFLREQPGNELMCLLVQCLLAPEPQAMGGLPEQVLELLRQLLMPESALQRQAQQESDLFIDFWYGSFMEYIALGVERQRAPEKVEPLPGNGTTSATAMAASVMAASVLVNDKCPLLAPGVLALLVELISFCVSSHGVKAKFYELRKPLTGRVATLLRRKEKWLQCAAVRFLRLCLQATAPTLGGSTGGGLAAGPVAQGGKPDNFFAK